MQKRVYHIKPEYFDLWNNGVGDDPDITVDDDDVEEFSEDWEMTREEVLAQLIPIED